MKRHLIRGALAALALGTAATAGFAAEATYAPADTNKDGFVSRDEYMSYVGKMWDDHHMAMMKTDKTWKKDMMSTMQYGEYWKKMTLPNGMVDPGKVGGK